MINKDPEKRPKLEELLTRPIFNIYSFDEELEMDDCNIRIESKGVYDHIYHQKSPYRLAHEVIVKSKWVKEGEPSIYLLKSDKRIDQNGGFQWFDIGKSTQRGKGDHKVII